MESYAIQIEYGGFVAVSESTDFNFGTGDFTFEAWVKTLKGGTIIGRKGTDGGPGNGGFLLVANPDGTIKFATDNGFGFFETVSGKAPLIDGVWHHIAAVRQGVTLSLYLDGEPLPATTRGNAQPPLDVNNSLRLTIGTVDQQQEPNRFFMGLLAEIRLWNTGRSANDIILRLGEKLPADTSGLVGYWAADFGLVMDFSSRRQGVTTSGMVTATTDGPPVLSKSEIPCLFLFAGQYATGVKYGGASGQWQNSGPLYITSSGIVILGSMRINGASFVGNTLSWPMGGNQSAASLTFKLSSDANYFWPQGPQTIPLFEGWLQSPGSGPVDFRGLLQPERQLCGTILSNTCGQVVLAGNGASGAVLTLGDKTSGQREHFCVYDDNTLLFMMTGAAVGIDGPIQSGSRLILKDPASAGLDAKWSFEADGTIRSKSNNNLAIAVAAGNPQSLRLAVANPNDPSQKWILLSQSQFVWNGVPDYVLAAAVGSTPGVYDKAVGQQKANGSPNQLWYFVRNAFFVDVNGYALTVVGSASAGAPLALAKYQAGDTQRFVSNGRQIVHVPSGLIVKLDANMNAVLADAGDLSDVARWIIAPLKGNWAAPSDRQPAAANDMVDYVVYITTASTIFAGTDDRVEIALVGESQSTSLVELSRSETHADPFERGQTDRFTVCLPNVGHLRGIFFRYGENTWFGGERWVVSEVAVYDPTTLTGYSNADVGEGMQYQMPYQTTIRFTYSHVGGDDSTMSVCKAPTQDAMTRGWVDHTWVVVKDKLRTTYFDCAGGHEGPGTINDIATTKCDLNKAVLMATAYPIDSAHPYQPVYGHNDVTGKETCGVRASGRINWDGQCHQIANRLLFICNPRYTLYDAGDKAPTGYGLSCILWGPYGVGFDDWCRRIGVEPPSGPGTAAVYDYIQRFFGDRKQSERVMYHANNMRDSGSIDNPQAPGVKEFFRNLHNEGFSNSTIGNLVCLPEDRVIIEEQ